MRICALLIEHEQTTRALVPVVTVEGLVVERCKFVAWRELTIRNFESDDTFAVIATGRKGSGAGAIAGDHEHEAGTGVDGKARSRAPNAGADIVWAKT